MQIHYRRIHTVLQNAIRQRRIGQLVERAGPLVGSVLLAGAFNALVGTRPVIILLFLLAVITGIAKTGTA